MEIKQTKDSSKEALVGTDESAQISKKAKEFAFTLCIEKTQDLARELIHGGLSESDTALRIEETYNEVTKILCMLPTDHPKDIERLSDNVAMLCTLNEAGDGGYAMDFHGMEIGDIRHRNTEIAEDIFFANNILSAIQRIGKIETLPSESGLKDSDANEQFLTLSTEELFSLLSSETRDFFHSVGGLD